MSSNLKVKSTYFEENSGNSALVSYQYSQKDEIKEITLGHTSTSSSVTSITEITSSYGSVSIGPTASSVEIPASLSVSDPARYSIFVQNQGEDTQIVISLTATDGEVTTSSGFPFGTVSFFKNEAFSPSSRNINYLYNVNGEGEYIVKSYDSPLLESNTSFGILRTNPKLTGNVKITVDSSGQIWLNSIAANDVLSDSRFKKVPVSIKSNYVIDVYNFFDKGTTPPEVVYDVHQDASDYYSTQRDFSLQYDRFYTYGSSYNTSNAYTEDFSYFAPLRLEDTIPDYFVIFRANGPLNSFTYNEPFETWKTNVNQEILKSSLIVKVFDLTENSGIGTYIRNFQNHPARISSEMSVSLQTSGYTTFNGISYTEGSFAKKAELLDSYFSGVSSILGMEDFLTSGFQRNKVLSGSILNLEFLFNDFSAEEYTINRYFGLYMKGNDLASFSISDKALEQHSLAVGQTPLPRAGVDGNKLSSRSFIQNNPNGIKIFADSTSIQRITDVTDVFTTLVSSTDSYNLYFAGQWENSPYLSVSDALTFYAPGSTLSVATASVSSITQMGKEAQIGITGFTSSSSLTISSLSGYKVDFSTADKIENRSISSFNNDLIQESSRLFYLKDKNGNFYNINSTEQVNTKIDNFNFQTDIQINLNETTLDISDFTGINEMLSQTPATLLTTSGKANTEFTVNSTFNDFDYIEIVAHYSSDVPLRWRIRAQSPLLNPGEFWPDYSIITDTDGSLYYETIFHPGNSLDLSQLATTIQNAFRSFPFIVFDIVSDGNTVYIRHKENGIAGNSLTITYSIREASTVSSYGFANPAGKSTVYFFGGSQTTKNRVYLDRTVAEGILTTEYFQTTGLYSQLVQHQVFGNTVSYSSYLEEPFYDDVEQISYFNNAAEYAVIELPEGSKFQLTHDNKVTSYSLHQIDFGLFSIFPLRDFDTDYWSSDYGKNYNAELMEYFDNIGAKEYSLTLASGASSSPYYQVVFFEPVGLSGEYTFIGVYDDGSSPLDLNGLAQLNFSGPTASVADLRFYTGDGGLTGISLAGSKTPSKLVVLPGNKILYFEENLLSKFKGFFSLSPTSTLQDSQIFTFKESQWDFSRFALSRISSEYQRMQENYLKDQALVSKVVPYDMKWVSPDGKDIRDNPYRFNLSRAFGVMNFSPSGNFPDANASVHSHEWPYLGNVPDVVDPIQYADFSFSYFFDPLDSSYDFTSTTRDWFSEYFVVGYPSEIFKVNGVDSIVPLESSERYSIFKYDPVSQSTYTIFRGIKILVGESFTANKSILIGSSKYDGYKFSSVIVPVAEDDLSSNDLIEFDIIVNEKFGFIVNMIKVPVSSYKNLDGNLSYVDLYTMENRRDMGTYKLNPGTMSSDPSITTDYLYYRAVPADVRIPYSLSPDFSDSTHRTLIANSTIEGTLTELIHPLSDVGYYSFPYSIRYLTPNAQTTYVYSNIQTVQDYRIVLGSSSLWKYLPAISSAINVDLPAVYPNEHIDQHIFYYASGGDSYYNRTREILSFYEITKILQGTSTEITPVLTTIGVDGSLVSNKILFQIVSPVQFYSANDYVPVADTDKPSELFNYPVIGAISVTQSSPLNLYRYQGNYVPKFKNVFLFGSREQEDFALEFNNDFKLANTFIAESLNDTYYLRNQYFCKVAEEEILRINPSGGYKSVYPLVGEVAIDFKDLFVWISNWDNAYYRKYSTVSNYEDISGATQMKEIKSFLGSKAMQVKNEFELFEFIINGESPELTYTQVGNQVTVNIDVYSKFLREMMGVTASSGARKEFLAISQSLPNVIDPSQVDSLTMTYLEDNIMNLYDVSGVTFYLLQTGNSGATASISERPLIEYNTSGAVESTLTQSQFITNKYVMRSDIKTTLLPNLQVQISFTLDSRFYTSLGFGVNVARI